MLLSEAILLGLPEIYFRNDIWFDQRTNGRCEGCLVGAALYASGYHGKNMYWERAFFKRWPWTRGWHSPDWDDMFAYLTDLADQCITGKITPTQIADLIRSIEPTEEVAPAPAEASEEQEAVMVKT